jgi:hypothetical protein
MPLITNGRLLHEYEEQVHPGMRLGRHQELDARSLSYLAQAAPPVPIKPMEWKPCIPTLDQGQLGSCTGNAGTYHLSQLYGTAGLGSVHLGGKTLSTSDAKANEQFAVELYHEATIKDGVQGTYPPDDTGSSGLGVCRALKAAKLITSYQWATSAEAFANLLQRAGCIIGVPWYESWFHPDSQGFVDAGNWESSGVAGGHEIYVEALEAWNASDLSQSVIRFHNSWGDSWGDHGCGRMRLSTYDGLRQHIDVAQAVR